MNGTSLDIKNDQLEKLRELFPEVFTEGKIDWEKLKASLGEDINFNNERYVLNWAGKSEAFKILQQSTTDTLIPSPEESINFDTTQNVFIEGENLRVLKALQKSYYGKIKCIIIDPPYNTGSDSFIYPDKFSEKKEDYQKRVGDKDEEGYMMKEGLFHKNSKDSGHYHSNWLNMMYPRLFLARNLMRDDGVIFVHIDDNEVHNLRLMMNEIFGEENFIAVFPWRKRTAKSDVPFGVSQDYEWIIAFTKTNYNAGIDIDRKYFQTDDFPNDRWRLSDLTTQRSEEERQNSAFEMVDPKTGKKYPHNPKRVWGVSRDTFQSYYDKGKIVFPDDYDFLNISTPAYRVFESEDKAKALKKYGSEDAKKAVSTFLSKEVGMSEDGNKEIVDLFGQKIFSFPKPVNLIKYFLNTINESDYIILDFFAGSGSTAQAIIELNKKDGGNRKFILTQLPELCDEKSEAFKAGFKSIADISKARIRKVIERINEPTTIPKEKKKGRKQNTLDLGLGDDSVVAQSNAKTQDHAIDLGFKVFKVAPSSFKIWRSDEINGENLTSQLDVFTNPVREGSEKENMLYELMLKAGYELTSSVDLDKKNLFYRINNDELIIALEKLDKGIVETIISLKPKKVITLDNLFAGNDQLKTNTVLQMKDAGIDFKTI
ncbi:MAG: site-specific DNA-methyltransferase [Chitinophagaceae bacterium]|nr:site-specific DNA-methyltransferase [Chitinophagaceae bacterium]